jgi:hypothetical protein
VQYTDSAGQFNIRVDLNSDFMKEMGNEFVLGVVSNKTILFIGQSSYLFGSIERMRRPRSAIGAPKSESLKAIVYHPDTHEICAGEEWDFKGKLSFVFEGDRKNILKFEKKDIKGK